LAHASSIEWTDSTWNPLTGCSKVSPGCRNCYAERMALRLRAMGQPRYAKGFRLTLHEDLLEQPLTWKKSRVVFVTSMSDLFHEDVPLGFIKEAFRIMKKANWHIFQIITKRAQRLREVAPQLHWPENVWMGVSVENQYYTNRIDLLRAVDASVRFLSLEPLLGPLPSLNLDAIDWVIVGGESGPGARPMKKEWVVQIKERCIEEDVPFFFKQWGGINKKKIGRLLEGRTWDEMPVYHLDVGCKLCRTQR
jgi:protein gp37